MKRLVLIDGHAMVYRAYYAYPALSSPSGKLVNAVYGFTALLLKTIDELKPDYLAVAFDLPFPTFRHAAYIAYQAKRKSMDLEMKDQISIVQEVVEAADIPIFTAPGFEADDVIATVARQAIEHKDVNEVIVVTGDRDMLQLVGEGVKICMPAKGISQTRIFDSAGVREYLGVTPGQVVDYKALTGDPSDNYPGVPGIGPKTAVTLIEEYGTLENIYKRLEARDWKLGKNIAKKLVEGQESGVLSKELATIRDDVPLEFDLERAKLNGFKENKRLINKLKELGFRSLIVRVTGNATAEINSKSVKKNPRAGNGSGGQIGLI
ncbi:MAG: DNA polymerase I [Microgenomates group bacterium Gr01-1014_5]|nr:MAG: DNA polymerase I [Microgenomates group bacterium Gr01-1014_5]